MRPSQPGSLLSLMLVVVFLLTGCAPRYLEPDLTQIYRGARSSKGKTPIIVIPGILGSRLVNTHTGEVVWPGASVSKDDDLDLPIKADFSKDRDALFPAGLITTVKLSFFLPEIEVYQGLLSTLSRVAGFQPGDMEDPPPGGYQDTYYVFSYDWRKDNVESAEILGKKIENLKLKLGRPDLKFNILAHSMGGIIARYYAMYGRQDVLSTPLPKVTWAGAKDIDKIIMVGTPNEGSMDALRTLVEGYSYAGGDRTRGKVFNKVSAAVAFSSPAIYQLLPHRGAVEFLDEKLRPFEIDLFDIANWKKYQWSIYSRDKSAGFQSGIMTTNGENGKAEAARLAAEREAFLRAALDRASRFQKAIDQNVPVTAGLQTFIFGGDCEPTLVRPLIFTGKNGRLRTVFTSHEREKKAVRFDRLVIAAKMFEPGDGRVTRRSLLSLNHSDSAVGDIFQSSLNLTYAIFGCEAHGNLPGNPTFQDNLLTIVLHTSRSRK